MKVVKDEELNPQPKSGEKAVETNLRPQRLAEFIGQPKLKEQLSIFLRAAKGRGESLDHILFYGPPGLGKTTLANLLAKEMGANIKITSGPALTRVGDLASILTGLKKGDFLFIDEIHRLNKLVEETLYSAMEDFVLDIVLGKGPSAKTVRLNLQKFTIVGATTRIGLISGPMRDRFGYIQQLDFYEEKDLTEIVERTAKVLNTKVELSAAREIARRARGTPRIANRLLRRVRDYAQINPVVAGQAPAVAGQAPAVAGQAPAVAGQAPAVAGQAPAVAGQAGITYDHTLLALEMLGVDEMGLSDADRKYLEVIKKQYGGGPVGVENLAAALSEDVGTITEVYEPYLMKRGLVKRTSRGRELVNFNHTSEEPKLTSEE